jgi:hypothetical protein
VLFGHDLPIVLDMRIAGIHKGFAAMTPDEPEALICVTVTGNHVVTGDELL